jgi:hypothetical protein
MVERRRVLARMWLRVLNWVKSSLDGIYTKCHNSEP